MKATIPAPVAGITRGIVRPRSPSQDSTNITFSKAARIQEAETIDKSHPSSSTDILSSIPMPNINSPYRQSTYSMPKEIGCFSYGVDRIAQMQSRESLRYYHPPNKNVSLSAGYPDKYITRDKKPEHLDALLDCMKDINTRRVGNDQAPIIPNFCTWRGIMSKIIRVPYASKESWELGGTIYMEEHESEEKQSSKFGSSDKDMLFTYWGYKFETLSTIPIPPRKLIPHDPHLLERETETVNTNVQFCSVFASQYGPHDIVLGGEVDCLTREVSPGELPQSAYAELKTNRVIETDRQRHTFEKFKLLRIWEQSFLAGVPKVIIGFRTDGGEISHVHEFDTAELPRIVRNKPGMWDPNRCVSFGDSVLTWIKSIVTIDDSDTVYTICFSSEKRRIEILAPVKGGPNVFIPENFVLDPTSSSAT
ncbi:hypothetical protein BSLG_000392 [Batrachochytrium salamandrivorans]|nr:hypothetical protein BSLG_000392 [Batrachochytrium salamandrivorans]